MCSSAKVIGVALLFWMDLLFEGRNATLLFVCGAQDIATRAGLGELVAPLS